MVLCVVLIIELLHTHSDSIAQYYCKMLDRRVVDVAGTYGSTVLPFMSWLVGYNKCSFYRGFYIAAGRSVQRAFETVALLKSQCWLPLTVTTRSLSPSSQRPL